MVEIEEMNLMFTGDLAFAHKEHLHSDKVPIELEKELCEHLIH